MYSLQTFGILLVIFGYSVNGFLVPLQKYNSRTAPPESVKFQNSYYKYHLNATIWPNARAICAEEGGHLAIVNSQKEADFLVSFLEKYPGPNCFVFIGFHSLFKKGEYVTLHGETISKAGYDVWAEGEPNDYRGEELCGSFNRNGGLNDILCDAIESFICEIPVYDLNDALKQISQPKEIYIDIRSGKTAKDKQLEFTRL